MNIHPLDQSEASPGTDLGSLEVTVSEAAGDRYWRGVAIEHPARSARLLYPPMAVNLTILLVQERLSTPLLHTRQDLRSHRTAPAPATVSIRGQVTATFEKRGRHYLTVESEVATGGPALWSSTAEFCVVQPARSAQPGDGGTPTALQPAPAGTATRTLTLDADRLRTYSRAGNFHSDDAEARAMGLPGKVAMGMQTFGPAYALALDRWGTPFVERGGLRATFFGLVLEDDTVEARVSFAGELADFQILNLSRSRPTAAGTLSLR